MKKKALSIQARILTIRTLKLKQIDLLQDFQERESYDTIMRMQNPNRSSFSNSNPRGKNTKTHTHKTQHRYMNTWRNKRTQSELLQNIPQHKKETLMMLDCDQSQSQFPN
jgi:hypothetical protein